MLFDKARLKRIAAGLMVRAVIIDTETTGLGDDDQVIEIAAVRASDGEVLVNSLVKSSKPVSLDAYRVHGIGVDELANAGDILDVLDDFSERVAFDSMLVAFNSPFDERLILQSLRAAKGAGANADLADFLELIFGRFDACVMELANRYFHEHLRWSYNNSCFKRLSLARCMELAGLEFRGPAHRALADAYAARDLLKFIAESEA